MHLFATTSGVKIPVSDWMPLPDTAEIEWVGYRASELDDGSVSVKAYVQYSRDGGFSGEGSYTAITASATTLNADKVHLDAASLSPSPDGTGSNQRTHVRVLLECTELASGSPIVPFRCVPLFRLRTRPVIRVPVEQRAVGVDNTSTYQFIRLTDAIPMELGESFNVRAILSIENSVSKTATGDMVVEPVVFYRDRPLDATQLATKTAIATPTQWDSEVRQALIPQVQAISDWKYPAVQFGVKVKGITAAAQPHAGKVSGVFELWHD